MGNIYEYIVLPDDVEQTKTKIKERQEDFTISLWPLQEPDDVDCSDDRVPALLGQRKAVISELADEIEERINMNVVKRAAVFS